MADVNRLLMTHSFVLVLKSFVAEGTGVWLFGSVGAIETRFSGETGGVSTINISDWLNWQHELQTVQCLMEFITFSATTDIVGSPCCFGRFHFVRMLQIAFRHEKVSKVQAVWLVNSCPL